MALHTILGAGGAVGNSLVPVLLEHGNSVRLVSRAGNPVPGTESMAGDITNIDVTRKAVEGSAVVYLLVGLKYDIRVWRQQWPKMMSNIIESCKASSARLIFFDNVYMYGYVEGPMTEKTPFRPISEKGRVRAAIAQQLLDEMGAGGIQALIARSADFYGPSAAGTSVANLLVMENLAAGKKAQWLCNADAIHSMTFVPDAAKALALLSERDGAFGQTWHLPTAPRPLTGRDFAAAAASALGKTDSISVLPKWLMSLGGVFNREIKESVEMAYQYESPYIFDSSKFEKAFSFAPTSYAEGIEETAKFYRNRI